ncbi:MULTISPECIES: glycosyltransferase 61 family protein [unclassified Mucilaginibacter]|uniref:glycosyltransferase family 61 protein n=1 Tax=unclassified Mucilaginibacter TaxID=2617802 RepID=UPI002AC986A9|nr:MULTISPECIES: glycosyltransferase 61 family protein [unclassified Mucilaginibacter]MEB0263193.1 glycosyltransferase 61 family protein [Mucilaginibacter sp. 10I4]MEB0280095.1 glycosyltransferase 61 family protein [Mucilaginibacter sp. 10B2]MEB0301069.1 glycosyltransferase 61 family protein [Mucilaginibacter sp. 5C4]WPX24496.1 glycosyltransferase 61 family protein [Mucilaginibacter sp. 5C4]
MNVTHVDVRLPLNLIPSNACLFEPYQYYQIAEPEVANLRDIFVTYSGFCADEDGLIRGCHHDHPYQMAGFVAEAMYYYQDVSDNPENLIELNADKKHLLVHHPWFNYYHWLCECIPRLWRVRAELDNLTVLLPEHYLGTDFITGSLKPFNIKDIFVIPPGKSLLVPQLKLPAIKPICDSYHQKELRAIALFYKEYAAKHVPDINLGDKVYLSRRKAGRKKVINEDDVESLLQEYGFRTVYNEDFSFLEQVAVYRNVNYLVSIHGSGLTNMLFMPEGSSILEIMKAKTNDLARPSFVFWYQADALGHNYFAQISDPLSEPDDYFFGDFFIDIDELRRNMNLMMAS